MSTLDLALIGNGAIGALVNPRAEIVWTCFPRFDGDPVFCSLLRGDSQPEHDGAFVVEMIGAFRAEQQYAHDTPVVITRFFNDSGAAVQVTDFAPRTSAGGVVLAPPLLVRRIEVISGNPTIRVRLRPMENYGAHRLAPQLERAASGAVYGDYLRYAGEHISLRLATNARLDAVLDETPFAIDDPITLMLSADHEVRQSAAADSHSLEQTVEWWREWVGALSMPAESRDAVVRAAITLKLNVAEDTGAIIAAMTTSIPEARGATATGTTATVGCGTLIS